LLSSGAWAQTSLVSGALDGSVSDSSGGRIPGVAVTVRDTATNLTREVSTNAEGVYHVTELPVGIYEVSASQPGFAPYRLLACFGEGSVSDEPFAAAHPHAGRRRSRVQPGTGHILSARLDLLGELRVLSHILLLFGRAERRPSLQRCPANARRTGSNCLHSGRLEWF